MVSLGSIAKSIFGDANQRKLKPMWRRIEAINALEPEFEALTDDELRAKTVEFKARVADGETLDELLEEAFAAVREGAKRALGQRHYDVQLLGGMVLHEGKISEMKTGEGKTLVATLAAYLNALDGKGVHVVTVNDYLASRDADWMGQVYRFMGLQVGCVIPGLSDEERRAAYAADITYATNNELGFDYLRDNMKYQLTAMVQRPHNFAIVDEVDSILVDEARTPLIISGPTDDNSELYRVIDGLIPLLEEEHYEIEEKARQITLTEEGNERVEEILKEIDEKRIAADEKAQPIFQGGNLYDIANVSLVHHTNQALRAHKIFQKDRDYIVKSGRVVIIDEFTGRMMEGRRYSDGLHQALEAKEGVAIQPENQTLASITFQNYFRLYNKLSGMTGTALTEEGEFDEIYKLRVMEIPTNKPIIRLDEDDEVYRTAEEKTKAILDLVEDCHKRGQPILVGTVSIEKSETLAKTLKKHKIPHNVLNARFHEQEAQIVAQAGVPGAVTIATNMAGRGTDIQLGGNLDMRIRAEAETIKDEAAREKKIKEITADTDAKKQAALDAGGLYVVGTERHESRRIDNQLRGRTGRQGDPGASKFFLSLGDDLMRIFGTDRMEGVLKRLGLDEGEAIVHPWINGALAKAQQKVEQRNFDIRKNLLKFDNVMNDQRKAIFEQRIEMMRAEDLSEVISDMRHQVVEDLVEAHIPPKAYPEQWDSAGLEEEFNRITGLEAPVQEWAKEEGIADEEIRERLMEAADKRMAEKAANLGPQLLRRVEKTLLLQVLDKDWRDHLGMLDHLRQAVALRGLAQRDPLNEYKTEAFELFNHLLSNLRQEVTTQLLRIEMAPPELGAAPKRKTQESHNNPLTGENEMARKRQGRRPEQRISANLRGNRPEDAAAEPLSSDDPASWGKIPRNSPCPCGSGKKYKHCHGKVEAKA